MIRLVQLLTLLKSLVADFSLATLQKLLGALAKGLSACGFDWLGPLVSAVGSLLVVPGVDDPAGLREWMRTVCRIAGQCATLTGATQLDDLAAVWLGTLIETEATWLATYALIHGAIHGTEGPVLMGAMPRLTEAQVERIMATMPPQAGPMGAFDLSMILAILQAILDFLAAFWMLQAKK
jgi:hypothetical protein